MFWRKERFDMSKTFFQFAGRGRSGRGRGSTSGREGVIIRNSNSEYYTVFIHIDSQIPKSHWLFSVINKDLYEYTQNIASTKTN